MRNIFHFLSEDVCKIDFAMDVTDLDKIIMHILTNAILFHLNMPEAFGSTPLGPVDTGLVIIIYNLSSWHK